MKSTYFSFCETSWFTKRVQEILSDEEYARLQLRLIEYPEAGDLIRGGGGIRKLRQAAKGSGTRGGARVIYYFAASRDVILMLDIYAKNERSDLTPDQLKELRSLVEEWKTR